MMNRVSTYTRLLALLSDGQWHGEDDLREITRYPREWVKELCREGHDVSKDASGAFWVRLAIPQLPHAI
jgi:hypothetical protein